MRERVLLAVFGMLVAGCATGPRFEGYNAADAACVKGNQANIVKFFSEAEAHVEIREIDGVETNGRFGPFCVAPGKHQLGISGYNNGQTAQDYVDLTFEARRQYLLRANRVGISIAFRFVDVTSEPTTISEFRFKIGSSNQSSPIPIFIPKK